MTVGVCQNKNNLNNMSPVLYGMASMDYLPVSFLSMKLSMPALFWHQS
ncbi:TPA: hypothetical protein M0G67_003900 [Salmonella enterica subsp. enterica serovar Oranienburg]|nr:hypothetical protein [Salmonella enterica subsp. enterica serovar Oranienburg]